MFNRSLPRISSNVTKLDGHIPFELCRLTRLQVLDLAHNNLSGTIPKFFNNFKALATNQESGNAIPYSFYGGVMFLKNAFVVTKLREMQYDTILTLATSLDLSANKLIGEIPPQVAALKGL